MGRPRFDFKQFTIHQEKCAMKVCTDSCIFGAWMATKITSEQQILDIGTGTGLLMLMLAQQSNAQITGVEIEESCAEDLKQNINFSPWANRLHPILADARSLIHPQKFDLIVTNPPFFQNDLKTDHPQANIAKHGTHLAFEHLLQIIDLNISEAGSFGVLLPYNKAARFNDLAVQHGFQILERMIVRESEHHAYFRTCARYRRSTILEHKTVEKTLTIRDKNGAYTPAFTSLLKDYYLYL